MAGLETRRKKVIRSALSEAYTRLTGPENTSHGLHNVDEKGNMSGSNYIRRYVTKRPFRARRRRSRGIYSGTLGDMISTCT